MELKDHFTYEIPNGQFARRQSKYNNHWDGKISLFNLKTFQIYTGLEGYVKKYAKENGYSYKYVNEDPKKHFVDTKNLFKSLSLPDKIKSRDYQLVASSYALTKKRCMVISPTASGKSLIIYMIIRHLLSSSKSKGLLIVPTINLVAQMYSDFEDYSTENGWNVNRNCHKIYEGQSKESDALLTISTWQSLQNMPEEYFHQFDFVIGDEGHSFNANAKTLTSIMCNLINCDVRIGLTGTLDDSAVHKLVHEGLFGPIFKVIGTKELIDRKDLADFAIKKVVLRHPQKVRQLAKKLDYRGEIELLIGSVKRNEFIAKLSVSLKGNTLILFTFVDKHGKILHEMIQKLAGNRKVFFVCGDTELDDRELVRALTEKEEDAIIVASSGTMSTGANIKNLHNLIFASPTKSKKKTLQSIGRVLRLGDKKTKAILYDIADDLRTDPDKLNYALKHYEERSKIYDEEQFTNTVYTVELGE